MQSSQSPQHQPSLALSMLGSMTWRRLPYLYIKEGGLSLQPSNVREAQLYDAVYFMYRDDVVLIDQSKKYVFVGNKGCRSLDSYMGPYDYNDDNMMKIIKNIVSTPHIGCNIISSINNDLRDIEMTNDDVISNDDIMNKALMEDSESGAALRASCAALFKNMKKTMSYVYYNTNAIHETTESLTPYLLDIPKTTQDTIPSNDVDNDKTLGVDLNKRLAEYFLKYKRGKITPRSDAYNNYVANMQMLKRQNDNLVIKKLTAFTSQVSEITQCQKNNNRYVFENVEMVIPVAQ